MISVRIRSPFIDSNNLAIERLFPYGTAAYTHASYYLQSPEKRQSFLAPLSDHQTIIKIQLDKDKCFTSINWKTQASFEQE